MKKLLFLLCLAAQPAFAGLILSPAGGGGGGGDALTTSPLSQFAATTSAQLAGVITNETGSGALVFATSPTFTTPILGTPTSGTLTNCTGLPAAGIGSGTIATARLGSGTANNTVFLRGDSTWQAIPGGGDALTSGTLAQFAATTSAELLGVISNETGTGSLVFATSPTLVTPALGTPASGTLTSCTGLPISTGVSGLGTGVATFLATPSSANLLAAVTDETGTGAAVFATSPTFVTPILGTPTSGNASNLTALNATQLTSGTAPTARLGSGTADATTFLRGDQTWATPTGLGLMATDTLWDAKGDLAAGTAANTGAKLTVGLDDYILMADSAQTTGLKWGSPAVVRTALGLGGTPSAGQLAIGNAGGTAYAATTLAGSGATISLASNGTMTISSIASSSLATTTSGVVGFGSIELGHASDTTIARDSAGVISVESVVVPTISSTSTLTNKRINSRVTTISSNATWSPSADTDDVYEITAQAADVTTISNPSGTPVNGQKLMIRVTGTAARALTWSGSKWRASSDLALPTTTTTTKTMYLGFIYNTAGTGTWDLVAKLDNF